VTWNTTGPQSPQGPIGLTGATGPAGPQGPAGQAGAGSTGLNPLQVALHRWYDANQVVDINACGNPQGLAFDGENIWVGCTGNEVQKIRVSDGVNLGAYPAGDGPIALVFDGFRI